MQNFFAVVLLQVLIVYLNTILIKPFVLQNIENDLLEFNVSCTNDNCQSYEEDSLKSRACHCGKHCSELGTCCLDSPYANVPQPKLKPECRYLHAGLGFFIVDQCPIESVWSYLCNGESSEEDDIQNLVPVTSLKSSVTYKNYYCFRCHEATDDFIYWKIKVKSKTPLLKISQNESKEKIGDISFIYKKDKDKIMAHLADKIDYITVDTSLQIPSVIMNLTYSCNPDVISDCSEKWPDDEVRNKCQSYMALKSIDVLGESTIMYKNIHCALCNYENLTNVYCKKTRSYVGEYDNRYGGYSGRDDDEYSGKGDDKYSARDDDRYRDRDDDRYRDRDDDRYSDRDDDRYSDRDDDRYRDRYDDRYRDRDDDEYSGRYDNRNSGYSIRYDIRYRGYSIIDNNRYRFTFTYLLDINPSDGELVGKKRKCSEDYTWDPFAKKCRKLACALPGFVIKNRRCVEG